MQNPIAGQQVCRKLAAAESLIVVKSSDHMHINNNDYCEILAANDNQTAQAVNDDQTA